MHCCFSRPKLGRASRRARGHLWPHRQWEIHAVPWSRLFGFRVHRLGCRLFWLRVYKVSMSVCMVGSDVKFSSILLVVRFIRVPY